MKTIITIVCVLMSAVALCGQPCVTKCGVERWAIKTVTDAGAATVKVKPVYRTVRWLRTRVEPTEAEKSDSIRIVGIETMTFRIKALVIGHVRETDKDFHIVISEPTNSANTMIVEFPSADCAGVCNSIFTVQMATARADYIAAMGQPTTRYKVLPVPVLVEIIGVGFWDKKHSNPQHGVAPNNIELHPVVGFRVL